MKYTIEQVAAECVEILAKYEFTEFEGLEGHRGHRDLCPHGRGGKATQTAALSVNYCPPRLICNGIGCMNRNIE